jgi:hypothetical protein
MDTNLTLVYVCKTIDTTDTNMITTGKIIPRNKDKNGSLMPDVPLKPTKKQCYINNGVPFILSGLKTDNYRKKAIMSSILW